MTTRKRDFSLFLCVCFRSLFTLGRGLRVFVLLELVNIPLRGFFESFDWFSALDYVRLRLGEKPSADRNPFVCAGRRSGDNGGGKLDGLGFLRWPEKLISWLS